jgi:hypothetical protein
MDQIGKKLRTGGMDLGDNDVVVEEEKSAGASSKPASRFTTTEVLPENHRDVGFSKSYKPSPMNSTQFSGVGNAPDAPGSSHAKTKLHQKAFSGATTNAHESEEDGLGGEDDDDDEEGDDEDINLKNEDLIVSYI